jgi:hypothetical protein
LQLQALIENEQSGFRVKKDSYQNDRVNSYERVIMKLFYKKICCYTVTAFGSLVLILAGCQNGGGNDYDNGSRNSAVLSKGVSNDEEEKGIYLDDRDGENYNPVIDPANFVGTIDNPYLTLMPGRVWVYEGVDDGEKVRIEVEVTQDTKTILGVITTVVRVREWADGKLKEDTFDWYAQDKDGNVWYFGEDSKEIDDDEVVSTDGSWEAGLNMARPGMIMKADPQTGDAYRQEFLKGEAEDMGQVLKIDESITIGLGRYEKCIRIKDWTPLEPDVIEHKFYSRDAGNVILEKKVAGETGHIELIEMKTK